LQTSSSTSGLVMVDQFYYPAWQGRVVGGAPVELQPAMPQGLLEMHVAAGHEQVRLDIPVGKAEIAGRVLSVASALVCGILFWVGKGFSVGRYSVPRATPASA
jgi:hypothetical protein